MGKIVGSRAGALVQPGKLEDWVTERVWCNARVHLAFRVAYADYIKWCKANGRAAMMPGEFETMLGQYGFDLGIKQIDNVGYKYINRTQLKPFA